MTVPFHVFGLLALSLVLSAVASAQAPSAERYRPTAPGPHRQLFLDDVFVESRSGLTRVIHQPVKLPAPIIGADQPWESNGVFLNAGPAVLWDDEDKIFKMWYLAYNVVPPRREHYLLCYATSQDGITWQKPNLGVVDYQGSRNNNIVLLGHSNWELSSVIKDPHEPNPERRYKSLSFDDRLLAVAFSPDGIHWKLYPGNPVMRDTGDSHNILPYDETVGKYIGYLRPGNTPGEAKQNRKIGYSVSDDFVHWSPIETIIQPDALDPAGDEFYEMPVARYEGAYVGFLWVYHNAPQWPWPKGAFDPQNLYGTEQTMECQLAFSRDSKHFVRAGNRETFLPVGAPGAWDGGMAFVSTLVPHGDELWVYYGAFTARHFFEELLKMNTVVNGRRWIGGIGLAKLRRDGFASLHAGPKEGYVMTRLLTIGASTRLVLNADAKDGLIEAEVVDAYLHAVPGYTRAESRPLRTDGVSQACGWIKHPNLSALSGKAIRLRFFLRNADLFAFQVN